MGKSNMTIKIDSAKSLSQYIRTVIREATQQSRDDLRMNAVNEKEQQQLFSDKNGEGAEKSGPVEPAKSSKTVEADSDDKTPTVDSIIEKLNSIRSGKSFKDEQIETAMNEYFDSLSEAERSALQAFLKGIAQIVTGEIRPPNVSEPDKAPYNVEMQKKDSEEAKEKKHVKPNVIKNVPEKKQEKKTASSEDTTPPAPITAVKR